MVKKVNKARVGLVIIIIILVFGITLITRNLGSNGSAVVNTGEPVKIGLIMPLTSNAADIGKSNKFAAELAVKEINAKGGINGRPIQLVIEDSKGCDSKEAVTAMQKLVNVDKVSAVYSACSNVAIATHPVAETGKTVHFGCASNPTVTTLGDYMFRIAPSDDYAGKVAAQYIKDDFNAQNVAVLHCDNDWCVGIKDAFIEEFKKEGGNILTVEQIHAGASDVKTELTKIKNTNPDLIYFAGYPQETVIAFKQAKELGLDVPFFGGDAWMDQSIAQETGSSAENKFFTTPAKNYDKNFEQKVNGDIAICTPEAYDIIYVLAQTMEKVGTDSTAVKNELYNLRNYMGQSGVVGLDENGDLLGASFDIKTYSNGEIVDYKLGIKST